MSAISTSAEFVISGTVSSPEMVTKALGVEPDSVQHIGEEVRQKDGLLVARKRENSWALDSRDRCASVDLEDHLRVLLEVLLPRREAIRSFTGTDRVFFWIYWESDSLVMGDGPILAASICHDVALLGAKLNFDLFCSLAHEEEE